MMQFICLELSTIVLLNCQSWKHEELTQYPNITTTEDQLLVFSLMLIYICKGLPQFRNIEHLRGR